MTVKDSIFYETSCIEKNTQIQTVQMVDPSKKVPDLNCELQDLLLEVVDLKQDVRSGGIPPHQFNQCCGLAGC